MDSKTLFRRQFLSTLGVAPLAAAAPRYQPKLAVQVYVWTQVFGQRKKPLLEGLPEVYESTRKAGYRRMELISSFVTGDALPRTRELVRKHGLQVPIVYHGGPLHEEKAAEKTIAEILSVAEIAKSLGASPIEANPNPKPKREAKTGAELDVQVRAVNRLADALARRGQRLILHHHDPEMADNAREWRHLVRNTDPRRVGFCVDFDWVLQGGRAARGQFPSPQRPQPRLDPVGRRGRLRLPRPLAENLRLSREYVEKVFSAR